MLIRRHGRQGGDGAGARLEVVIVKDNLGVYPALVSDIKDALVAAEIDGLAQTFAHDLQRGADDGVIA